MKIAVVGATGNAGSRITSELLDRGHHVTAIVRNVAKVPARPNLVARQGDVLDAPGLAELLKGHDLVVSAVHFTASDPGKLIAAVKAAAVPRYIVVGGAGSLEVAPGLKLFDAPGFPQEYLAEARKGGAFLDLLRQETALDWSFLSPSAFFIPGERTGRFRLGTDQLLTAADGKSSISFEDYAVALADEAERPAHPRRRFTVGY
ncbi:MAG: NAD(P)-dependent oxidoreductase [Xanthobacteraceae bacterium]|nr:NAD(P)-dependent oxidoreductase [Xanthobacteraceae bacterium]